MGQLIRPFVEGGGESNDRRLEDTYDPQKSVPCTRKPHTHIFGMRLGLEKFDLNNNGGHLYAF